MRFSRGDINTRDIRVSYKRYLDGGGSAFGQDYIPFLLDRGMPRQARVRLVRAERRFADSGWNIHRRFFNTVGRFLKPGGVILIQENNHACSGIRTRTQTLELPARNS